MSHSDQDLQGIVFNFDSLSPVGYNFLVLWVVFLYIRSLFHASAYLIV